MSNTFLKLENSLIAAIVEMRAVLAEANIPYLTFDIEVRGRVSTGELKIEFKICDEGYSNTKAACGGRLEPTLQEFIHRHGWQRANAPLMLPAGSTEAEPEPIDD